MYYAHNNIARSNSWLFFKCCKIIIYKCFIHAIPTNTVPIQYTSSTFVPSLCIVCLTFMLTWYSVISFVHTFSRECRDSDGCSTSRSSSSVGSHREDELSSLLQIILCCETSLLTSGVHSGLRVRRGSWSIPNLIGNDDSIRCQWWTPSDVYIGLRWKCINRCNSTRNCSIIRAILL